MKNFYTSALLLLVSSLTFAQQPYYNNIDFSQNGAALKQALATKITNTHTKNLSYEQIWSALKVVDENPDNSSQVLLIYGHPGVTTGQYSRTRAKNSNGGNNGQWNREHTYAKSLGTPDLGQSGPGADAHHLRASDVQWNNSRGNQKYAAGSGNSGNVSGGWYPGDEWKGDIARMMMYMYLRYGDRCKPTNIGPGPASNAINDDMIALFLQWNAEDPVSEVEDQRNAYLGNAANSYGQGNRNPFIDNPYLATKIWGGQPAEDRWGTLSNENIEKLDFSIYPNPSNNGSFTISSEEEMLSLAVYAIDGRLITSKNETIAPNTAITFNNLSSGVYLVEVKGNDKKAVKKLLVK